MPADTSPFDLLALLWFLLSWGGYNLVQDHLITGRKAVNEHMKIIRRHWMERMLERDNRIMDSQLFGHTMHSCTFFASTNILVLAGLVGAFGGIDRTQELVGNLSFTSHTSRELFEWKLLLLTAVLTFGFFKFTWALRQYNYCCALIGAAPLEPPPEPEKRAIADNIADALTLAVTALNAGMRSYYFALAALAWIAGPIPFITATTAVIVVLARRQAFSATERVVRSQALLLESKRKNSST